MVQANLRISFWGDALLSITYILNRISSKSIPSTLYELWKGEKPDLSIMHLKGCATYIHNTSHEYGKLGLREKKCIFIRYLAFSKGYIFGRICEWKSIRNWVIRSQFFRR